MKFLQEKIRFILTKKQYARLIVTAISIVMLTVHCYAAADTSKLFETMQTALQGILSIVGAGIAVFGVVHLVESQSSHDPTQRSAGMKELGAGLGIILVGNILIPVFIDIAKSGMSSGGSGETPPASTG